VRDEEGPTSGRAGDDRGVLAAVHSLAMCRVSHAVADRGDTGEPVAREGGRTQDHPQAREGLPLPLRHVPRPVFPSLPRRIVRPVFISYLYSCSRSGTNTFFSRVLSTHSAWSSSGAAIAHAGHRLQSSSGSHRPRPTRNSHFLLEVFFIPARGAYVTMVFRGRTEDALSVSSRLRERTLLASAPSLTPPATPVASSPGTPSPSPAHVNPANSTHLMPPPVAAGRQRMAATAISVSLASASHTSSSSLPATPSLSSVRLSPSALSRSVGRSTGAAHSTKRITARIPPPPATASRLHTTMRPVQPHPHLVHSLR